MYYITDRRESMKKHKAIPDGYMTVGEAAKKMNTTVRTLQYYDKVNVLKPSAESEGGRRLYTDKDIIRLYQILSMKQLGFSLDDIKNRFFSLDTPEAVANELTKQAASLKEKIDLLTKIVDLIEVLKGEVLQMNSVNWQKYADIVAVMQSESLNYWVVKHLDDKLMNNIRNHGEEKNQALMAKWKYVTGQAKKLQKAGVPPKSQQGMEFAKEFWDYIMEFTCGDMSLLPELLKFERSIDKWEDDDWKETWESTNEYTGIALEYYFEKIGYDPFEEGNVTKDDKNE